MGRNESILILKFKETIKNKKSIYIVIWTQDVECFYEYEFINKFLSENNVSLWNFCRNQLSALKIAQKMYFERNKPEYGIKMIDTELCLSEFGGSIINSPLVGSPKNLKLVKFNLKNKNYIFYENVGRSNFEYYQELPKSNIELHKPIKIKNLEEIFLSDIK